MQVFLTIFDKIDYKFSWVYYGTFDTFQDAIDRVRLNEAKEGYVGLSTFEQMIINNVEWDNF